MDRKTKLTIDISSEQFEPLRECVQSKFKTILPISIIASSAIAFAAPVKSSGNVLWKRMGIGMFSYFTSTILGNLYIGISCSPILKKIEEELYENRDNISKEKSDTYDPLSDSSEIKSFDSVPLAFTTDPDMNPPSSFSLDPGFKLYSVDEEKEVTKIPESKTLTYEELRKRSREEYQLRPYKATPKPQENKPEMKEDDNWSSSSNTWPRKTNIYGDVLE